MEVPFQVLSPKQAVPTKVALQYSVHDLGSAVVLRMVR